MAGSNVFSEVSNLHPDRNYFDLSHTLKADFRFGELYPVMCKKVMPGDVVKMSTECVIRLAPSIVPFSHEIDVCFWNFYVPFRILERNGFSGEFEEFITGGLNGDSKVDSARLVRLGRWVSSGDGGLTIWGTFDHIGGSLANSLVSLFSDRHSPLVLSGVVPYVPYSSYSSLSSSFVARVVEAYPILAYNRIYVDYFADENIEQDVFNSSTPSSPDKVVYDGGKGFVYRNCGLLLGNWDKDYFTSALPWQQRGEAPAFPISGLADVGISGSSSLTFGSGGDGVSLYDPNGILFSGTDTTGSVSRFTNNGELRVSSDEQNSFQRIRGSSSMSLSGEAGISGVSGLQADLSTAVSFDVAQMRLNVAIQRFMERNARAGVRYTEFLKSHFGVSPTDTRLDRAEYIGGSRGHVVISEVLQTSKDSGTTEGVGDYSGHGLVAFRDNNTIDGFRVEEFGCIMTIMMIRPKAGYHQGISREWMYSSRYDWPFPEFVNLSEQAIMESELYVDVDTTFGGSNPNYDDIFGYQGRYDEFRTATDRVAGNLIDTLNYWHLNRTFSSMPQLSKEFIKVDPESDDLNRVFQYVGTDSAPAYPFIGTIGFNLSMLRPLPLNPDPGLVDHSYGGL